MPLTFQVSSSYFPLGFCEFLLLPLDFVVIVTVSVCTQLVTLSGYFYWALSESRNFIYTFFYPSNVDMGSTFRSHPVHISYANDRYALFYFSYGLNLLVLAAVSQLFLLPLSRLTEALSHSQLAPSLYGPSWLSCIRDPSFKLASLSVWH